MYNDKEQTPNIVKTAAILSIVAVVTVSFQVY